LQKDLDPAVISDHPICAHEDCPPDADGDGDAGVLPAEQYDLVVVVVAVAVPDVAKCRVDSEKRIAVGPEPTNVYPPVAH
jgi:hypothetical protein